MKQAPYTQTHTHTHTDSFTHTHPFYMYICMSVLRYEEDVDDDVNDDELVSIEALPSVVPVLKFISLSSVKPRTHYHRVYSDLFMLYTYIYIEYFCGTFR